MLLGRAVGAGLDRVNLLVQLDALLREHLPVACEVDRATVSQRLLNLVAELSVELRDGLALAAVLPKRLVVHASRAPLHYLQPLLAHHAIVDCLVLPVHVLTTQGQAGLVVVIDHRHVRVRMTTRAVQVHDDEHVRVRVKLLSDLVGEIADPPRRLRVERVHLLLLEAVHIRPGLDLATMSFPQRLRPVDELLGARGITSDRCDSVRALGPVPLPLGRTPHTMQLVVNLRPGLGDLAAQQSTHASSPIPR